MPKPSKKHLDMVRRYRNDYEQYARDIIQIRDHNQAKIVPFIFNRGQKILHAVSEKMKSEFGFVRIVLLKSRRFGGSTYVEGRFYHQTSLNKNINAFIVAHEKESTNTLFEMTKLMQEKNPIAPSAEKSNEKLLRFDTPAGTGLKSEFRLATAKNVDAGRSQGIHLLHGSEEAYWPDGHTLLNGLLQCMAQPPAPHEIYRESTANGFGNSFQEIVFKIYSDGQYPYYTEDGMVFAWKNPELDWVLVSIPWMVQERFVRGFRPGEKDEFISACKQKVFVEELTEWQDSEAIKLRKKYNLSWEQLHWREWMITNQIEQPSRKECERKFRQEYPDTVPGAFLTTGQNVYCKELCDDIEAQCKEPLVIGEVVDRAGQSRIKLSQFGKFRLWEKPEKSGHYFITVDSGGGLKPSHVAKGIEPDPTCIDVWNHLSGVQCAQWHGHIDYGMIAGVVYLIGRMYGMPVACVELQNHGYTVVKDLVELRYPLYESKPGEPGWLTTKATKPRMVDDLGEMARNGGLQIRCAETVLEMRTFIELNGKFNAASGCHDDRVDSAGMAAELMTMLPKRVQKRKRDQEFSGFSNIRDRVTDRKAETGYKEVYV